MGIEIIPAPSSGLSGIDIRVLANTYPTQTGSYGRVTANVSVPEGTYIAYQSGYTGAQWTVNGSSVSTPTGQASVVSFTTTGSTFIIDYSPGTQLTWVSTKATPDVLLTNNSPIIYGEGRYFVGTNDYGTYWRSTIYYSTDAINWTRGADIPDGTDTFKFIIYNSTSTSYKFVQATNRKIQSSTDGLTWTRTQNDSENVGKYNCVAVSNTNPIKFVIGNQSGNGNVYYSSTGATWTLSSSGLIGYASCRALGGGNDNSLFIYWTDAYAGYWTSTNGITWTSRTSPMFLNPAYYAGYVNSLYWISGIEGTYSSTNAITWTLASNTAACIDSITYKDGAYWAVDSQIYWGDNATKIWKSTDGINWVVIASCEEVNGLLNDGSRLITHTGNYSYGPPTDVDYPKIYISTSGAAMVKGSGEITLIPVTATPATAS